jgi:hypothetical protein
MIALPVILLTYKRFPLSNLTHMFLCQIGSIVAPYPAYEIAQ